MPAELDAEMAEAEVTAAELALGILDGSERAAALRRVIAEPKFAREVETWRTHFGAMFAEWPDQAPPPNLLKRIEQSLEPERRSAGYWPAIATALTLIAASLLLTIVLRPVAAPPGVPGAASLVASLDPVGKGVALPAFYNPANGELRILTGVAVPAGRAAELWMIGQDGVPRSLGLLNAGGRSVVRIASPVRGLLRPGLKLAISSEPTGGSPTGLPTGPIVASGALISS
jgi:anti-sigma-K factor RskA